MKAMVLNKCTLLSENANPLQLTVLPDPILKKSDIVLQVSVCGVCHTELDEIEGRTAPSFFPVVPGHQVVGTIVACGSEANKFKIGDRVGVGWIFSACGSCTFCKNGNENLCRDFKATGKDADGGYAELMAVDERFAYRIPDRIPDVEAAPLLCAGAIGYRSLRLTNCRDGQRLGLTGFGASGHLVMKLVKFLYPNIKVYVFARSSKQRSFAADLGAVWAGDIEDSSPEKCDAIIDTTPVWKPVVEALKNLERGGRLVINAIGKEEVDKELLLRLDYRQHLWLEKEIKSVANVCRSDVKDFIALAAKMEMRPAVQEYALEDANSALRDLKAGNLQGAKVLRVR